VGDLKPMTTPFTHKTEHYYGSQRKVHTVSWKGKGEVDGNEIRAWCVETYGQPGYQDAIERTRWMISLRTVKSSCATMKT
jgi:hypothetical protein